MMYNRGEPPIHSVVLCAFFVLAFSHALLELLVPVFQTTLGLLVSPDHIPKALFSLFLLDFSAGIVPLEVFFVL